MTRITINYKTFSIDEENLAKLNAILAASSTRRMTEKYNGSTTQWVEEIDQAPLQIVSVTTTEWR